MSWRKGGRWKRSCAVGSPQGARRTLHKHGTCPWLMVFGPKGQPFVEPRPTAWGMGSFIHKPPRGGSSLATREWPGFQPWVILAAMVPGALPLAMRTAGLLGRHLNPHNPISRQLWNLQTVRYAGSGQEFRMCRSRLGESAAPPSRIMRSGADSSVG